MTECERFQATLVDLLYGQVEADEREHATQHRSGCASCSSLARELEEAREAARELGTLPPPPELDRALGLAARASIDGDVRRQALRGGALHVAAAVVLALGVGALGYALGISSTMKQPAIVRTPEVEPIEREPIPVSQPGGWKKPARSRELPPEHVREWQRMNVEAGWSRLKAGKAELALTFFEQAAQRSFYSPLGFEARLGIVEAQLELKNQDAAKQTFTELDRDVRDEIMPDVELPAGFRERLAAAAARLAITPR